MIRRRAKPNAVETSKIRANDGTRREALRMLALFIVSCPYCWVLGGLQGPLWTP